MVSRLKPFIFLLCLVPFAQLACNAYIGDLGVNPIDFITRFTGSWALIFLIGTLAVTPARRLTGWNDLIKLRRMLGLFAFAYALTHFATFLVLDHFFDWQAIGKDILKRPYVTAGFTAFVIMVPLALTSTAGMIRRLGGRRWQLLHRLTYVAAAAAVLHYWWLVKADVRRPETYALVIGLLFIFRAWWWGRSARAPVARRVAA